MLIAVQRLLEDDASLYGDYLRRATVVDLQAMIATNYGANVIRLTADDINALLHGQVLLFEDGEYTQVIVGTKE